VLQSPSAVILHATAAWSEPCKRLGPRLEAVARAAGGALTYARLDVDAFPQLGQQLAVRALPTVWGIVKGKAVDNFNGVVDDARLRTFIETLIAAAEAAGVVGGRGGEGDGALADAEAALSSGDAARALAIATPALRAFTEREDALWVEARAATEQATAQAHAAAAKASEFKRKPGVTSNPVPREDLEDAARLLAIIGALRHARVPAPAISFVSLAPPPYLSLQTHPSQSRRTCHSRHVH
jgi:putative thioredoxin